MDALYPIHMWAVMEWCALSSQMTSHVLCLKKVSTVSFTCTQDTIDNIIGRTCWWIHSSWVKGISIFFTGFRKNCSVFDYLGWKYTLFPVSSPFACPLFAYFPFPCWPFTGWWPHWLKICCMISLLEINCPCHFSLLVSCLIFSVCCLCRQDLLNSVCQILCTPVGGLVSQQNLFLFSLCFVLSLHHLFVWDLAVLINLLALLFGRICIRFKNMCCHSLQRSVG